MPMPDPHPLGLKVTQAVQPISGEIVDAQYDAAGRTFNYLVAYTDEHGHDATRWFAHAELATVVPPTDAPKKGAKA